VTRKGKSGLPGEWKKGRLANPNPQSDKIKIEGKEKQEGAEGEIVVSKAVMEQDDEETAGLVVPTKMPIRGNLPIPTRGAKRKASEEYEKGQTIYGLKRKK